ncbi:MAG TPA: hypothetical protein VGX46_12165 [Vicinamibacterales bacterium]|nr:hypothetical protein [Vicinamibacterales bacterium]
MAAKVAPVGTTVKAPRGVRYIKLGQGDGWEKDCVDRGILRIGFGTTKPERFRLCQARRWDELAESFKQDDKNKGTVTSFTNPLRRFFEDDGSTLWITFVGERLYWGVVDDSRPERDADGAYRAIRDGWRCTDLHGEQLKSRARQKPSRVGSTWNSAGNGGGIKRTRSRRSPFTAC